MSDVILEGKNLRKTFQKGNKTLTACSNINFQLHRGETLGIVGESGCGKSTLLKMVARLYPPTSGQILLNGQDITNLKGRDLQQIRRNFQMVFQNPTTAFYSRRKVIDAVAEPMMNYEKLTKHELCQRVGHLLDVVGLPLEYMERYPHSMSGGQQQRLGIARALAVNPQILLCDEATSSLDVSVQDKVIRMLVDIQKQRNLSMLFVCHNLSLVCSVSHRMMVMYLGSVVEILPSRHLEERAKHPYTKALLASVFTPDMDKNKKIIPLEGEMPSGYQVPTGCPFHTRCHHATTLCRTVTPTLTSIHHNHQIACHLYG